MDTSTPTGESEQSAGAAAIEAPSRFRLPFRGQPTQQQQQQQMQQQQQQQQQQRHKIGGVGGGDHSQMQLAHRGYFNGT
jgi:transcription initiation factor TFIID subunit TAF12